MSSTTPIRLPCHLDSSYGAIPVDPERVVEPADRLELHELPGRYGDAIDDRAWDRLDDIFSPNGVFDLTAVGGARHEGLAAIKEFMDGARHPLAHLMMNIYVDESPGGDVQLHFRILAPMDGGSMGTAAYCDDVVRTTAGWRVVNRVVSPRGAVMLG